MRRSVLLAGLVLVAFLPRLAAQEDLDRAVERAREAFFGHEVGALLATSDTVRLNIPGTAKSASMKPGQAARILEKYLHSAQERDLTLVRLRTLAEDHAYAELDRSYVVRGTSEERRERVMLGFRRVDGTWRLREVRVTQ
ncbi:MAG: hypothetical protein OEO20_11720 [Gemmatimonadota bacterium]|nr:hypothetical protein [Gemmatimonadota bacterium]MDH3366419.1 hypothetical protein [Gemmatimonadota bacterium]MDH3478963.1 hypothetical protein [Gemmatimonadota bacterium]MDH3570022.1 hypothetical protein [Gemmatimonadota bacterium]MDH5550435.1 hypothetical protein [Gemmatimonadota bacterium]